MIHYHKEYSRCILTGKPRTRSLPRIKENVVEALLKIKPELHRKYVVLNNGKKVLYVKLRKALYGLLNSGLLFWKDLSSLLIKN